MKYQYQRYWTDFEVSATKLLVFRVAFFTIIGIDAFLQIEHAPRYGAGGFNVSHVPWLDWLLPEPTRTAMVVLFLTQAYLAFAIVFGVGGRLTVGLLAAVYGYCYFVSQLDSYQHHYLVFLMLVIASFVPWRAVRGESDRVRSWALRLALVQIAIVYFWAAVSKMDAQWIDGQTLARQIRVDWARDFIERIGFGFAAGTVLLAELFLAVAVLWRRLWPLGLVVGVGFHAAVELSGFRIGLFSYLMFAIYLLLVPGRWFEAARSAFRERTAAMRRRWTRASTGRIAVGVSVGVALGGLVAVWRVLPYAPMGAVVALALVAAIALVGWDLWRSGARSSITRGALALAAASVAILGLHASTEQALAYHKYWAGSSRRLGIDWQAREAYQILSRDYPEYGAGHYHLGRYQREAGEIDAALESFERAQRHAPDDYRAFLAAALLHHRAERGQQALEAARRVVELQPDDANHRQLARRLVAVWEKRL